MFKRSDKLVGVRSLEDGEARRGHPKGKAPPSLPATWPSIDGLRLSWLNWYMNRSFNWYVRATSESSNVRQPNPLRVGGIPFQSGERAL